MNRGVLTIVDERPAHELSAWFLMATLRQTGYSGALAVGLVNRPECRRAVAAFERLNVQVVESQPVFEGPAETRSQRSRKQALVVTPFDETVLFDRYCMAIQPINGIWAVLDQADVAMRRDLLPTVGEWRRVKGAKVPPTVPDDATNWRSTVLAFRSNPFSADFFALWQLDDTNTAAWLYDLPIARIPHEYCFLACEVVGGRPGPQMADLPEGVKVVLAYKDNMRRLARKHQPECADAVQALALELGYAVPKF